MSSVEATIFYLLVAEPELIAIADLPHFYAFVEWQPEQKDMGKFTANWFINEFMAHLKEGGESIDKSPVSPLKFREFLWFVYHELISGPTAKKVLKSMFESGKWASHIILEQDLWSNTDNSEIESIIQSILESNQDKVDEYRQGKQKLFGFFVGASMKALKGKADPTRVNAVLKAKLDMRSSL